MTFSIAGALDRHVAALNEERQADGMWHPSSLFGCDRRAVYGREGVDRSNPPGARSLRVFRLGHIIHELVQTAVEGEPEIVAFYAEVKVVDEERGIKGHADGLVFLTDGTAVVIELKSIGFNALKFAKQLPKEDHEKQATLYVDILRRIGGEAKLADGTKIYLDPIPALNRILFAYVAKDDMGVIEFLVEVTEKMTADVDATVGRVSRYYREGVLPPRLPRSSGKKAWMCGYCDWGDHCWDVDPEGEELS